MIVYLTNQVFGDFPVPETPLSLDCIGCLYEPSVSAVRAGQVIRVTNRDQVLVNVHNSPRISGNKEMNRALLPGAPPLNEAFSEREFYMRFQDDVHPWKFAWISVMDHPFYSITDANGVFVIPDGLPPGTYTVEAYHRLAGRTSVVLDFHGGTVLLSDFELGAP